MNDLLALDDLVALDDSRGPGLPPMVQGNGDQNLGRGERRQQVFVGEAKSSLTLEARDGAEKGTGGYEIYSPKIWPGRPLEGRGRQPTGNDTEVTSL